MNRDDILDMFDGIRSKYIVEAIESRQAVPYTKVRRKNLFLIAAVIALTALLVGCGIVYVLKMQDLKLDERLVDRERWDQESQTMVSETVPRQVLTLSGLKGSPSYQAAQEWYEFEETYDPDHKIYFAVKDTRPEFSGTYDFYKPYTQEMADKIDEICEKYHLKPMGANVTAQTADDMLEYLGIESVLLSGAPAKAVDPTASYYEGGYFRSDFHIQMDPGEGVWPYQSLMGYLYSPKDCFNDNLFKLEGNDWQERNHTTKSGHELLILRSPTIWESWVFCDLPDATVTIRMDTIRQVLTDERGYQEVIETPMTDEQLDQILDTINFDLVFTPGDPSLLEGQKMSTDLVQTQNGYTIEVKEVLTDGYRSAITLGLTAPEDVDLEQYLDEEDIDTHLSINQDFTPLEKISWTFSSGGLSPRMDTDGKKNTVELFGVVLLGTKEGEAFPKGCKYNLFLNGLEASTWNQDLLQTDTLWSQEGIWNFEITIDQGDWRELEFIREPITIHSVIGSDLSGKDVREDVTITSLKMRSLGGKLTTADSGSVYLCDYRNDKFPTLVLNDGRTIPLNENLEPQSEEYWGNMIPLEEIDHLLLIDGTKLHPQK